MALTVTSRGTGVHTISATSFTLSPSGNLAAGSMAVLVIAADNAHTGGTAFTTFTVGDTIGNTWVRRTSPLYDPATENYGVEGAIFTTDQAVGAVQTGTTITVTFDTATVAKSWVMWEVVPGVVAVFLTGDVGAGANTSYPTVTTGSIAVGDLVIVAVHAESNTGSAWAGDTDTTRGTWSSAAVAQTGASTVNVTLVSQYKVTTTTAGTQTYDPVNDAAVDCIPSYIILHDQPQTFAPAGHAAGTGAAYSPPIKYVLAGHASGTGAAHNPTTWLDSAGTVHTGLASATGSAHAPSTASGGPRWACPAEYVVELFSSSATFGPNVKLAELWDLRNLGWSRYDRMPGRGFFTLYQSSPHLSSIVPITTHARITRVAPSGNVEVFNGIVSDYNSTGDDVMFDIYDYVSLLSLSRSGYRTMYPTKLIGSEIVSPQWTLAKNATYSPLGFVATGTIEDPLGTDDTTPIKTNVQFGLMDQMRLALFYDMTEMGRANTNHHVTFEITRTAPFTFNFWKNKGSLVGIPLVLNGSVSDYQYAPNWSALRNDLATLGTTVGGGAAEVVKTDATSASVFGLRQDVFAIKTLAGITSSSVESDQQQAVAARMLKATTEGVPALWLTLVPGVIEPFTGWDICDTMPVEIVNGVDSITGNWRVVGARAIVDEPGERTQLLVAKVLT
jgi:hypothetical protein